MFGAPVGRVYRRVPEEGQHGIEFGVEMRGETLGVVERRGRIDEPTEASKLSAADRRQTVIGQATVVAAVAQREPGLENGFYLNGPPAVQMDVSEVFAAPEQMGQIGLVQRVIKAAITRLPVANEHAVEVRLENGDRIVEPAAGPDGVDGRVRRWQHPQPIADGVARRTTQHMRHVARRDTQPESRPEQMGGLRLPNAQMRVQFHDQRDHPGTELRPGPTAGTPTSALPQILGEGGRLPQTRAPGRRQRLPEPIDPPLQAAPFPLQVTILAMQLVPFTPQSLIRGLQMFTLRQLGGILSFLALAGTTGATLASHTQVMPYFEKSYKYKLRCRPTGRSPR